MIEKQNSFKLFHVATVPEFFHGFFDGQIRFMTSHGIEVHVVSSSGNLLELFSKRENVAVHAIEMPRAISPVRDIISLWRLYRLFRQMKPDIVHAHTPKGGLLGMMAGFLSRVPVRIYTVHGLPYVTATGVKRKLLRLTEKISCFLARRVFCVSASLAEQVHKEQFCPQKKIKVINNGSINGVDAIEHFNPKHFSASAMRISLGIPQDALVVGFVGRLVKDKGVLELVEAWSSLREKFQNLHLLLIGPFEKKNDVDEIIKSQLYSDKKIHLTGYVTDSAPYYVAMDVLAFPTHREGFGLVAIEAAAMEIPVVSTRIPGCIDSIAEGETGTLVFSRDSKALTDALASYLGDPRLRRKHGEAGRKRVLLKFKPIIIWKELLNEYRELLPK